MEMTLQLLETMGLNSKVIFVMSPCFIKTQKQMFIHQNLS